jgi:hypothetical protein
LRVIFATLRARCFDGFDFFATTGADALLTTVVAGGGRGASPPIAVRAAVGSTTPFAAPSTP